MRGQSSRAGTGFTLVEAVVVVALIALAACLVLPHFGSRLADSRESTCQSNLKQIVFATILYSQDYDERLPLRNYNLVRQVATPDVAWHDLISPYLRRDELFICPEATDLKRVPHDLGRPGGYLLNNIGQAQDDPPLKRTGTPRSGLWNCVVPLRLKEFEAPAYTVLYSDGVPDSHGDVVGDNHVLMGRRQGLGHLPPGSQQSSRLYVSRHGRLNGGLFDPTTNGLLPYGFADGHVMCWPTEADIFLVDRPEL